MTNQSRNSIAFIVGVLISRKNSTSIYDYSIGVYFNFTINLNLGNIDAYDYTNHCHISGSGVNGNYSLFHYGNSSHITLNVVDNKFNGYDYSTNKHFSGSVNGNSISFYDYGTSKYYNYSI